MRNTNKKKQGQSFLDMVLQQAGSFEEVINAAVLNDASLTDNLKIGSIVNNKNIVSKSNVDLYKKQQPATEFKTSLEDIETGEGIGYWSIEETFIVS